MEEYCYIKNKSTWDITIRSKMTAQVATDDYIIDLSVYHFLH